MTLFPPELVLEVQPVAADRERVADAPAAQAVGRTGPGRLPRIALHAGCVVPSVFVVAKAGGDRAAQVMVPVAGTPRSSAARRCRLAPKQMRPAFTAHLSDRPTHADAALGILAEPPAACSMPRSFCAQRRPAMRWRRWRRRLGNRWRLRRLDRLVADRPAQGHLLLMSASSAASSAASFLPSASLLSTRPSGWAWDQVAPPAPEAPASRAWRGWSMAPGAQARRTTDDQQGQDQQQAHQRAAIQRGQPSRERGVIARSGLVASVELTPSVRQGGSDQSAAAAFFGPSAAEKMTRSSVRQ